MRRVVHVVEARAVRHVLELHVGTDGRRLRGVHTEPAVIVPVVQREVVGLETLRSRPRLYEANNS